MGYRTYYTQMIARRSYLQAFSFLPTASTNNKRYSCGNKQKGIIGWMIWWNPYLKQWAAVSTHVEERRVPPHRGSPSLLNRRAMWGREWAFTFFPPMISASPQVPVVEHSTAERYSYPYKNNTTFSSIIRILTGMLISWLTLPVAIQDAPTQWLNSKSIQKKSDTDHLVFYLHDWTWRMKHKVLARASNERAIACFWC